MRLILEIALMKDELILDYRPLCLSYFKNALSEYQSGASFERYYAPSTNKPFTFAVSLGRAAFNGGKIIISHKRIKIFWSTDDIETGITFYNALLQQKHKWYPLPMGNSMRLEHIAVEKEVIITANDIEIVFASPLCVRKHDKESNHDQYFSYSKEGFQEMLRHVLKRQLLEQRILQDNLLNDFSLEAIRYKKTVIKHHGQHIEATLGNFWMHGDIRLLTHFYLAGIGSRRSGGFGYFNILKQGGD